TQVTCNVGYAFVSPEPYFSRTRFGPGSGVPDASVATFLRDHGHVDQGSDLLQGHQYLRVGAAVGDQVGDLLGDDGRHHGVGTDLGVVGQDDDLLGAAGQCTIDAGHRWIGGAQAAVGTHPVTGQKGPVDAQVVQAVLCGGADQGSNGAVQGT